MSAEHLPHHEYEFFTQEKVSDSEIDEILNCAPLFRDLRLARAGSDGNLIHPAKEILRKIANDAAGRDRYIFTAEPTFGKSSIIEDFIYSIHEIQRRKGSEIMTHVIPWDKYRWRNEVSSEEDWKKLNIDIATDTINDPLLSSPHPYVIQILELPTTVPPRDGRDLGYTALRTILRHQNPNEAIDTTLFAGVVDYANQEKALRIRELITGKTDIRIPDSQVVPLLQKFGIDIVGIEQMNTKEIAALIRTAFGKMATREHIRRIDNETLSNVNPEDLITYISDNTRKTITTPPDDGAIRPLLELIEYPDIDNQIAVFQDTRTRKFQNKVIAMEHFVNIELGLGLQSHNALVVANDHNPNVRTRISLDYLRGVA